MEKTSLTQYRHTADASSIYVERTATYLATNNRTAVVGNLADAMRDQVFVVVTDMPESELLGEAIVEK
jgi:hypothetical protein